MRETTARCRTSSELQQIGEAAKDIGKLFGLLGLELTQQRLLKLLPVIGKAVADAQAALGERNAGQQFRADGAAFDPAVHEAIAQQPGEEGKVLSVVQKGYKLGDRVIRPAMVIVGKGATPAEGEATP